MTSIFFSGELRTRDISQTLLTCIPGSSNPVSYLKKHPSFSGSMEVQAAAGSRSVSCLPTYLTSLTFSSTGLLFELGPCSIINEGMNTTTNPYSWTNMANMIFLDQPVNVGYSYADNGTTVSSSPVAGKDVYAFLELFLNRFPKYADLPFHLAAESYGGTYAPNIANVIYKENKKRATAPTPGIKEINLESVMLANGLTDPYVQMGAVADFACEGPYPVYDDPNGPECTSLRGKQSTCQSLIKTCYKYNSRLTCAPAAWYCASLYRPLLRESLPPITKTQR